MGIEFLPNGKTRIRHPYWDGKRGSWKQVTIDTQDKRAVLKAQMELIASVEGPSDIAKYSGLSKQYRELKGDGGMKSVYDRCETEFDNVKLDNKFAHRYDQFVLKLKNEGKATNTISNYKSVIQRVLRFGLSRRVIPSMPITNFEVKREFRDRVWQGDERLRFWNKVNELDSHLKWALRLSELRPIRKMDIAPLTMDNLVLTGPGAPYIKFRPKKTGKAKPRDSYLPLRDKRTGEYVDYELVDYLINGRPQGCPYLFPRVGTEQNRDTSKLKPGSWEYLGDPDRHFRYLTSKAGITDFHMHDLKHIAITRMLKDEGWSRDELKDLGIQYSDKAIDVYLHLDAHDTLAKLHRISIEAKEAEGQETANKLKVI